MQEGATDILSSAQSNESQPTRYLLLDLPVDLVDMHAALERITGYIEAWRVEQKAGQPLANGSVERPACQVVTLNPEMVMAARLLR